jgi:hypothetical protein
MQNNIKHTSLDIKYLKQADILLYFFTITSIIAVILVPSYEGSIIDWLRIPPLNWLRYGSMLLLTTFLPGYFLLKILDKKEVIKGGASVVLSCLLSFFTMFIMGFSVLLCGKTITTFAYPAVIVVNIVLMIVYRSLKKGEKPKLALTISWPETVLFLSLLTTVMVGSIALMIYDSPLSYGDMWVHLGGALQCSQGFPSGGGVLMPGYPYLFHIYLAVVISLSGIPPATSVQLLYLLGFIPLVAFYSTIKEWIDEKNTKNLQLIATFLSTLLGFGSLYAISLKLNKPMYDTLQLLWTTTSKTYDIYMRILFLPDYVAPLWYIGLPCFFMLLYLIRKNDLGKVTRFSLIAIVTLTAYLGHIAEVIIFVIFLFVYDLLSHNRFEWDRDVPFFIGLVLVALVDLIAPSQGYIFLTNNITGEKTVSLPFLITLSLSALTIVTLVLRSRFASGSTIGGKNRFLNIPRIWKYARWVLLYFYVFSVVIWLTTLSYYDVWSSGGDFFVPFFVFPVRFGAVGLLAMLSLFVYLPEIVKDKRLGLFLSLIAVSFTLEQISTLIPSLGDWYPAYRYATFAFVGSCVLAAYGIKKRLSTFHNTTSTLTEMKKKIISCTLLFFIIIPSILSTSLYYVHVSSFYHAFGSVTEPELQALDYIKQNLPANASVVTFSDDPFRGKLYPFAEVNPVQNLDRFSNILLNEENPYAVVYVLGFSRAKYVYMTQTDYEILDSSKGIFKDFLPYFTKVFVNNAVTIYAVPPLTPSSPEASLAVLKLSPSLFEPSNTTWIDDSFTEGWNPYQTYGNFKNYGSEVVNGTMNISVTSNQSGDIWASYARSGLSLNTTVYSILSFNYRVANSFSWFTFELWNSTDQVFFYVRHLSDADFTTETFALPANQTVTRIEIIVETVKDAPANTTASASIDYIQFSAPTLTWSDDAFVKGWNFYKQLGNISNWSASSNGGILKLSVTSNQSGDVWVSYSLPLAIETENSVLSFRYKVDNDYSWFTIILQNSSNSFFYRGHLTDKTFTTLYYALPEGQTITRVELIVETTNNAPPQTTASAQIDSVGISQQPFSGNDVLPSLFVSLLHSNYTSLYIDDTLLANIGVYLKCYSCILLPSDPPIPVQGLIDWVSAGNTLIVFNTEGNGFFANLFGINNSSPLLSINNLNSGKVLYVNSLPTAAAGNGSDVLQPEFLEKVKELLGLKRYVPTISVLPVYNSIYGGMEFTGDLRVDTDTLMLQGAINLPNSPFPVNESTEIKIYGKINLTIKNATLLISPSESYMLFKPESYPIEGEVRVDGFKALIVADANVIYNSDMPISFKFKTTALSLYVRLPSINVSGTITFDQLDVYSALYVSLAGIIQQKAEIQGNVKFDTMWISNSLTIFSMFHAEGKILNLAETTSPRPTIPWVEVLSSPYNVAFNTSFLLGIAIYIVKKRRTRITINTE